MTSTSSKSSSSSLSLVCSTYPVPKVLPLSFRYHSYCWEIIDWCVCVCGFVACMADTDADT